MAKRYCSRVEPCRQRFPRLGPVQLDRRRLCRLGEDADRGLEDLHSTRRLLVRDRDPLDLERALR
jgi:hypothetical protein